MQLKTRGKSVMMNKGTMQNIYGLFFFFFFSFLFFFFFSKWWKIHSMLSRYVTWLEGDLILILSKDQTTY